MPITQQSDSIPVSSDTVESERGRLSSVEPSTIKIYNKSPFKKRDQIFFNWERKLGILRRGSTYNFYKEIFLFYLKSTKMYGNNKTSNISIVSLHISRYMKFLFSLLNVCDTKAAHLWRVYSNITLLSLLCGSTRKNSINIIHKKLLIHYFHQYIS